MRECALEGAVDGEEGREAGGVEMWVECVAREGEGEERED